MSRQTQRHAGDRCHDVADRRNEPGGGDVHGWNGRCPIQFDRTASVRPACPTAPMTQTTRAKGGATAFRAVAISRSEMVSAGKNDSLTGWRHSSPLRPDGGSPSMHRLRVRRRQRPWRQALRSSHHATSQLALRRHAKPASGPTVPSPTRRMELGSFPAFPARMRPKDVSVGSGHGRTCWLERRAPVLHRGFSCCTIKHREPEHYHWK